MSAGRIVAIVFGCLGILIGLGLLVGGGGVLWVDSLRDEEGYLNSAAERVSSDGYAVISEDVDVEGGPWVNDDLIDIRVEAESADPTVPVFIGIARSADVEDYLQGVPHDVVRDIDLDGIEGPDVSIASRAVPGARAPAPPVDERFWEASISGPGTQELDWSLRSGTWTFVIMRPGGERDVRADVSFGLGIPSLLWIGVGLLIAGGVLFVGGIGLLLYGLLRRRPPDEGQTPPAQAPTAPTAAHASPYPAGPAERAPPAGGPPGAAAAPTPYPLTLEGRIDPGLSRWQWLVKWILAIPHFVVLFFLGIALAVLTVVAFFAIVFTGRYPRGIFEFNVGVLRWSWRVAFYAFSAIGTDRYPPFSLDDDPTYPARFDVEYPERLSRGLVWVKWWLLAIPQYVIVTIFVGTWTWGYGDWPGAEIAFSGGLIGVLVIIAAVVLLFTGRYPESIFRLLIGLNRWVYRVHAYALLMRDEYPPFRLER